MLFKLIQSGACGLSQRTEAYEINKEAQIRKQETQLFLLRADARL